MQKLMQMTCQTRSHRTAQHWAIHRMSVGEHATQIKEPLHPAPVARPLRFQVLSAFVNIRSGQSVTDQVLAQHDVGDIFDVDVCEGNWAQPSAHFSGGARGWVMINGSEIGLGLLLRELPDASDGGEVDRSKPRPNALTQRLPLLMRALPVQAGSSILPKGTRGPVARWSVQRPMTLVHAAPRREAAVSAVVVAGDFVWSCQLADVPEEGAQAAVQARTISGESWHRIADPDGWIHSLCPAGELYLSLPLPLYATARRRSAPHLRKRRPGKARAAPHSLPHTA